MDVHYTMDMDAHYTMDMDAHYTMDMDAHYTMDMDAHYIRVDRNKISIVTKDIKCETAKWI